MATFNTINKPRTNNIIQKNEDNQLEILEGIINMLKEKAARPVETLWDLDENGDIVVKVDPDHNGIYDFLTQAKEYAEESKGYKDDSKTSASAAAASAILAQQLAESIVQVPSDWEATDGVARILNRPDLKPVATGGRYSDLLELPNNMPEPNVITSADPENLTLVKNTVYQLGTLTGNKLIIYGFEVSNYETIIYLKTSTDTTVKIYPSYKFAGVNFEEETLEAGSDYVISLQNGIFVSSRLDGVVATKLAAFLKFADGTTDTILVNYGETIPNQGNANLRSGNLSGESAGWYEMTGDDYKYNTFNFNTPITNANSGIKIGTYPLPATSNLVIQDRFNNTLYTEVISTGTLITKDWLVSKFPNDSKMKTVTEVYGGDYFEIVTLPYKITRLNTLIKII